MKKILLIAVFSFFVSLLMINNTNAAGLEEKLRGKILLQVEKNGEAWYVNPVDENLYFLNRPKDAFDIMRKLGLGISMSDYSIFSSDSAPAKLAGRILLRVQEEGQAYYVNPKNLKLYYLGRPADAFKVMRELGLGISNSNFDKINKSKLIFSISEEAIKFNDNYLKMCEDISKKLNVIPGYLASNSDKSIEIIRLNFQSMVDEVESKLINFPQTTLEAKNQYLSFRKTLNQYKDYLNKVIAIKENIVLLPKIDVDTSNWKEYKDTTKGFSIKYPLSWVCEDFNEENFRCSNGLVGKESAEFYVATISCPGCGNTEIRLIEGETEYNLDGIKGTIYNSNTIVDFLYLQKRFNINIFTDKYKYDVEGKAAADSNNVNILEKMTESFKFISE